MNYELTLLSHVSSSMSVTLLFLLLHSLLLTPIHHTLNHHKTQKQKTKKQKPKQKPPSTPPPPPPPPPPSPSTSLPLTPSLPPSLSLPPRLSEKTCSDMVKVSSVLALSMTQIYSFIRIIQIAQFVCSIVCRIQFSSQLTNALFTSVPIHFNVMGICSGVLKK